MMSLGDFCESVGQDPRAALSLMKSLNDENVLHAARNDALLRRYSRNPRGEMLPLTEDGHAWGEVTARIPMSIGMRFMQQRNFGFEGMVSAEGQRDLLKEYPQCRVKTVSGRVVGVGFGGGSRKTVKRYG